MNYLIINKKNVLEFVYSIDLDAFIKTVLADSDVHLQAVSKCGDSVFVYEHDYLVKKHNLQKLEQITNIEQPPF
jgi:hypothetical protein